MKFIHKLKKIKKINIEFLLNHIIIIEYKEVLH